MSLIFFACFASVTAQTTTNIKTCVCTEPDIVGGVQTQFYRAYFGYYSPNTSNDFLYPGPNNYFSPDPQGDYYGQPSNYLPGYHEKVFFLKIPLNERTGWILSGTSTLVDNSSALRCGNMTYQGRLNDGAAAANGSYDLQFTFYDLLTGGTMQGAKIVKEGVVVTNGIFTVQLDVGAMFINQITNPKFIEIGVRPGSATGNDPFTTLNPRQPITQVPYAINAQTAVSAVNAVNAAQLNGVSADQYLTGPNADTYYIRNREVPQTANFNITGNGTIGGNLTAAGTLSTNNLVVTGNVSTNCRTGFTAIAGGRLCVSATQTAGTFYGAGGAMQTCINMSARVGTIADVTLTFSQNGFNYFGGLPQGWLGDYAGDNMRPM
ncbi:MAG TPA: hypothetical protein VK308_07370 [Pyrinomonadaceae bacterium]|nr:hypothetical protein [Pyrinomonadaceae bacterium]